MKEEAFAVLCEGKEPFLAATLDNDYIGTATLVERSCAVKLMKHYERQGYDKMKVIPCTITYTLPSKRKLTTKRKGR